jgi:hypothetical protein
MGTPFHRHLIDFNPLLEDELVLDLLGVIRKCNSAGKVLDSNNEPSLARTLQID